MEFPTKRPIKKNTNPATNMTKTIANQSGISFLLKGILDELKRKYNGARIIETNKDKITGTIKLLAAFMPAIIIKVAAMANKTLVARLV